MVQLLDSVMEFVGVELNKTNSLLWSFFFFLLSRDSKILNVPIKIHCLFSGQLYEVKIYNQNAEWISNEAVPIAVAAVK